MHIQMQQPALQESQRRCGLVATVGNLLRADQSIIIQLSFVPTRKLRSFSKICWTRHTLT
jgi:hypothetical protein